MEREEATVVVLDNIERFVFVVRAKRAAKTRRVAVAAIAARARDANPICAAGNLGSIPFRPLERSVARTLSGFLALPRPAFSLVCASWPGRRLRRRLN
jgi:hypothetical protein